MTPDQNLEQARRKLLAAHSAIVTIAAQLQAHGVDTSALGEPVVSITSALADLDEAMAARQKRDAELQAAQSEH